MTEQNWIRSTCQVVCAYVTRRRQMRRFCRVFRASPLCVYNLSSCLTVTQVKCWETQKLASLIRSRLQETNQVSLHLPRSQVSLCSLLCNTVHKSALVVYLVSVYMSCVRCRKSHCRLIAIRFLTIRCCYILQTGPLRALGHTFENFPIITAV